MLLVAAGDPLGHGALPSARPGIGQDARRFPLAVMEAKATDKSAAKGLQQAKQDSEDTPSGNDRQSDRSDRGRGETGSRRASRRGGASRLSPSRLAASTRGDAA
jgi:hypothetical protein